MLTARFVPQVIHSHRFFRPPGKGAFIVRRFVLEMCSHPGAFWLLPRPPLVHASAVVEETQDASRAAREPPRLAVSAASMSALLLRRRRFPSGACAPSRCHALIWLRHLLG
jgi:hypothetical protein